MFTTFEITQKVIVRNMSNLSGYVYVMINPSYGEGVVKIGQTAKDPGERAKELSSATGVATPFIVVYKRFFNDCHSAEKNIHTILSDKGYRISDSREFFQLDITEAINTIIALPDVAAKAVPSNGSNNEQDLAKAYFKKAEKLYSGSDDDFSDIDKALELYKKAGDLGYAEAYEQMAHIYIGDFCERWSDDKVARMAIQYYKKAIDGGCWWCYRSLVDVFSDYHNEKLAVKKYFSAASQHISEISDPEEFADKIGDVCFYWFNSSILSIEEGVEENKAFFKLHSDRLREYALSRGYSKFVEYLDAL